MNLSAGTGKLHFALKKLRERWEDVKPAWTDRVRAEFETGRIEPLEQQTLATLRGIDRLAEILSRAQSECGR